MFNGNELVLSVAALAATTLYVGWKLFRRACGTQLTHSPDTIHKQYPSLSVPMVPTPYLFSGMLQTIYAPLISLKRNPQSDIRYKRETQIMSDGGTLSLDWYGADSNRIAVVMSGVGGSSYEYHIRRLVKQLSKNYRVVVMNHRGSGRTPLTSGKLYNAYDTDDFRDTLEYLHQTYPMAKLVAVGFSLGANLLTKYMGEAGAQCLLERGVAICCPFDMEVAGRALDKRTLLNDRVFQPNLMATLKRILKRNMEVAMKSPLAEDIPRVMECKRMSEIDTLVTAKQYGHKDCWEYYRAASSSQYVDGIERPYLAINSRDDPVSPIAGVPVDKFQKNPNTLLAMAPHGGHLGFFTGVWRPDIWYINPIVEFLS